MHQINSLVGNSSFLDLNHGRVGKIENLEPLTQLKRFELKIWDNSRRFDNLLLFVFFFRLYLRWNMIKKIENLDTLITLEELELYDNQITKIENLNHLVNLQ